MPPTFESDHSRNQFTARLLLHHFLGVEDISWLILFDKYSLNEDQKKALIFVKELGAIDNNAYRQLNTVDTLKASQELRDLKRKEILGQKGKGKVTYYLPGKRYVNVDVHQLIQAKSLSTPANDLNTPAGNLSTPATELNAPRTGKISTDLEVKIEALGRRVNDNQNFPQLLKKFVQAII